jgi:hypothetical protein
MEGSTKHPASGGTARLAAVLLLVGGLIVVYVGLITWGVACDVPGTEACQRQGLARTQFLVSLVVLLSAGITSICLWRGRFGAGAVALVLGLVSFAGWGLLNDAAIHGWDNLKVF